MAVKMKTLFLYVRKAEHFFFLLPFVLLPTFSLFFSLFFSSLFFFRSLASPALGIMQKFMEVRANSENVIRLRKYAGSGALRNAYNFKVKFMDDHTYAILPF